LTESDLQTIKRVVIAGGGTAGWTAAAALAQQLGPLLDITLVESEEIGTVGWAKPPFPTIRTFHALLGIDEREFMRATQASFKLGIGFDDWARNGDRYIHAFGAIGKATWTGGFHNVWLQARLPASADELGDYCLEHPAALAGKFAISEQVPDELRLPLRRRAVRPLPAVDLRAQGRQAHRRQDFERRSEPCQWLRHGPRDGKWTAR
jgi:tryptophan halogenase